MCSSDLRVVSADGVGEGTDPAAALMRTMVDAFAAYERALIAARTSAALQAKRARGEVYNGSLPFGVGRDAADPNRMATDPREAAVVDEIRRLHAAGWTCRAIAADLAARGLHNRAGRPLHFTAVARIAARAA